MDGKTVGRDVVGHEAGAIPPPPAPSPPPPHGPATIPPPPSGPIAKSQANNGAGKAVGAALLAAIVAGAALLLVLLPLLFFVPSFWASAAIAGLVAVLVLWALSRAMKAPWVILVGAVLFLLPLLVIALNPLGDEPLDPKPAPWSGAAWNGTEVEYWDLATGSRIGYVHFTPDEPIGAAPVMFLHGGPGGGIVPTDADFARELTAAGFEVYLFDQAGVGWSALLDVEEYTIDRMVADLEAIRIEIDADRMNLVGHSWGGSYAAHYLASYDDRVERAWLTNPGEYGGTFSTRGASEEPNLTAGGGRTIPFERVPPLRMGLAFALTLMGAEPGAIDDLATQEQLIRIAPEQVDTVATFQDNRCANNPFEPTELDYVPSTNFNFYVLFGIGAEVRSHDETEGLGTIETPMVIARGMCDFVPWDAQRVYRDNVPGAELIVIPNEGHDMRPADEIISFFRDGTSGVAPYTSDDVPSP